MAKITTAGSTNATSAGGFVPQRQPAFQARQPHRPTNASASRTHKPKFVSQNRKNGAITPFHVFCNSEPNAVADPKFAAPPIRKKGAPKSAESCTQPGCHFTIDFAWNWSVTSQTKKVAGIKAAPSSLVACLRIGASLKIFGHVSRSKKSAITSTIVRAIKVWT